MEMAVSAKRCPQCGKFSPMEASTCRSCGHHFQTHFDAAEPPPGLDRTQAFDAVLLPRLPVPAAAPAQRKRSSPVLWFSLIALASILAWAVWMVSENAVFSPAPAYSHTGAPAAKNAKDLYNHISISMSLYDLDETASGMGTVERAANPAELSLVYPFGDQSVHVLLYQRDPQSEDYRVSSVSLYQGKISLQHKATEELY